MTVAEDSIRRLTEHLASEVMEARLDQDCDLTGFSGGGRCIETAVAIRWEDGFADRVCEEHANRAKERGALVIYPKRHDGGVPSITCPACRKTSYHPEDIKQGYCGNCHDFTSPPYGVRVAP